MDITLFELVLIIKDTEKPILLFYGKDGTIKKYTYEQVATNNELLGLTVAGVWVKDIDGVQCYYVKIRG